MLQHKAKNKRLIPDNLIFRVRTAVWLLNKSPQQCLFAFIQRPSALTDIHDSASSSNMGKVQVVVAPTHAALNCCHTVLHHTNNYSTTCREQNNRAGGHFHSSCCKLHHHLPLSITCTGRILLPHRVGKQIKTGKQNISLIFLVLVAILAINN